MNFDEKCWMLLRSLSCVLLAVKNGNNIIFENDLFATLNQDDVVIYVNSGKSIPGTRAAILNECEQYAKNPQPCTFEIHNKTKNTWYQCNFISISAAPDTVLVTCFDITSRVEAEKSALSANVAKAQFLANMSHEIRTPLCAMLGFADLLTSPMITLIEQRDWISKIKSNGYHLLRIVDEILDISKVEFGRINIDLMDVEIPSLISEISNIFMPQVRDKKIYLNFIVEGLIPYKITSDKTKLKQILINLIGNAIKFTWKGKIDVTLKTIESQKGTSLLSIAVQDSGIGMDILKAQKLFKPFTQIDASLTRQYGGTGLGLSLAKNFASALGGTVRLIDSAPGTGSKFEVLVSTGDVSGVSYIDSLSTMCELESRTEEQAHVPLNGMKVLLVEDSADNRIIVTRFLKTAGASVVDEAENGRDGVAMALSNKYDLVFMDIQMPIQNGYEATIELRQRGYSKPIVALTAHAMKEEVENCLNAGCDCHLSKPINRKELLEVASNYNTRIWVSC